MDDRERQGLLDKLDGMTAPELATWIKNERDNMIGGKDLVIRLSNAACNGGCPVCGGRTDPQIGPEVFLRGTWQEVCHECGDRLNPALMESLRKLAPAFDACVGAEKAEEVDGLDHDIKTLDARLGAMLRECPFYEPSAGDPS